MTRTRENAVVIEEMTKRAKDKPSGTYEEMASFQFGAIATMLADISKSLAILANEKESEKTMTGLEKSLEQKPKTGHWIDTKEMVTDIKGHILHEVICSECSGISYFRGMDSKYIGANVCPSCGARMEREE